MTITSARVTCASIVFVSDGTIDELVTMGRGSSGATASLGVGYLARVRYGSTSTTVRPSVISHPAAPKYVMRNPDCWAMASGCLSVARTTIAANTAQTMARRII